MSGWSIVYDEQKYAIFKRLEKLQNDLPMEYAGVALAALYDVQDILNLTHPSMLALREKLTRDAEL